MHDTDEAAEAARKPNIIWKVWQWSLTALFSLIVLVMILPRSALGAPGAPVTLYWIGVGGLALAAALAAPPIFFRLPSLGKWISYAALLGSFVLMSSALGRVIAAYERTPAGQRELAEAKARELAEAKAAKAEQARITKEQAAQAIEAREAQKEDVCRGLIPQVIEMAAARRGVEIIELNNIVVSSDEEADKPLTCFADAITSVGDVSVTFGLEKTPQGQALVTLEMGR